MKKLVICFEPVSPPPETDCLLWDGWEAPEGVLILNSLLEEQIIAIRSEHMLWAFNTGLAAISDGRTLSGALTQGQTPSMWWTSLIYERHPRLSPNLYTIYKLRCLELLLERGGYDTVELRGGDSMLRDVMKALCQSRQTSFIMQPGKNDPQKEKAHPYWLLPAPLRAIIRYVHWWFTIRRKLRPLGKLPKPQKDILPATIITYFPNIDLQAAGAGRFRSRYWESLHDILNEEAQKQNSQFVHWLFIRFPSPDFSLTQCAELARHFQQNGRDGLSFSFLEQFLDGKGLCSSLARWLRLSVASLILQRDFSQLCRFNNSKLNFWPYMRAQWAESMRGWRCLERCLHNNALLRFANIAGIQRWNLFAMENCPWERMATEALRKIEKNGPVIGAQHSTLRPTDFRYFDAPETFISPDCAAFQPDIIAGNGDSACDQWRANGMPPKRLHKVEALRYLYLAGKHTRAGDTDLPPQPCKPQEPGYGSRLLVLTGFFQQENMHQLGLLEQALRHSLLASWRIILKPHPYGPVQWWLDKMPFEDRAKISLSHAPLASEFTQGTTVWACNSTSASLEAALLGLPLMVMAPAGDFDLCPIQNVPGLRRTANLADLNSALRNPQPVHIPDGYLDLDPQLPAWRELLGLAASNKRKAL